MKQTQSPPAGALAHKAHRPVIIFLAVLTLAVAVISLGVGYYSLSPAEVVRALFSPLTGADVPPQSVTVVWRLRMPRILAALLIGASLATSGTVYQTMFHNALVSPDILGVSGGASLGAAISIIQGRPYYITQLYAFIGGALAVAVVYALSQRSAYSRTLSLVLIGTVITMLCQSGVTMIKYLADPNNTLPAITYWMMGSLTKVDMPSVAMSGAMMLVGFLIILPLRWRINLLAMQDEEAQSLGVNLRRLRLLLILGATLLCASAVCLGGLIGWIGLVVPHIARRIWGPDTRRILPAGLFIGGLFLVLMDDLARSLLSMELPLGVLVSLVGTPFFLSLLLRRKKGAG